MQLVHHQNVWFVPLYQPTYIPQTAGGQRCEHNIVVAVSSCPFLCLLWVSLYLLGWPHGHAGHNPHKHQLVRVFVANVQYLVPIPCDTAGQVDRRCRLAYLWQCVQQDVGTPRDTTTDSFVQRAGVEADEVLGTYMVN